MSDHNTSDERERIEELLSLIESNGWVVKGYDADVDPYDLTRLTIKLEEKETRFENE